MLTEELWQQLHDSLCAFLAKRVDDHGHADDILQEVFMRVYRQINSVNGPRRVRKLVGRLGTVGSVIGALNARAMS